jgi:hypothetical protein
MPTEILATDLLGIELGTGQKNRRYPCGRWFVEFDDVPPDLPLEIANDWLLEHDRPWNAGLVQMRLRQGDDWWLRVRIEQFRRHVTRVIEQYYGTNYRNLTPPLVTVDWLSDKWCRLNTVESHGGGSSYAFVALADNFTRALGQVTAGDVHKPDGYKRAAKHRRGSVYQDDFGNCAGPHGVAYLR